MKTNTTFEVESIQEIEADIYNTSVTNIPFNTLIDQFIKIYNIIN